MGVVYVIDLRLGDELIFEAPVAFLLQMNIWEMVQHSGPAGMAVLAILFCFSIFSWTVIFSKWQALARRAQSQLRVFCAPSARPPAWKR